MLNRRQAIRDLMILLNDIEEEGGCSEIKIPLRYGREIRLYMEVADWSEGKGLRIEPPGSHAPLVLVLEE